MRKQLPDFKKDSIEEWYDLREDWSLIEASLTKQYGIRIRQHTDMQWTEFCTLVAGLMPDTPLGQIVTIRGEKDPKVIKSFNKDQRRIHREWKTRQAAKQLENPDRLSTEMEAISNMLAVMYGPKGVSGN